MLNLVVRLLLWHQNKSTLCSMAPIISHSRLGLCARLMGGNCRAPSSPENNFDVPLAFHLVLPSVSDINSIVLFENIFLLLMALLQVICMGQWVICKVNMWYTWSLCSHVWHHSTHLLVWATNLNSSFLAETAQNYQYSHLQYHILYGVDSHPLLLAQGHRGRELDKSLP